MGGLGLPYVYLSTKVEKGKFEGLYIFEDKKLLSMNQRHKIGNEGGNAHLNALQGESSMA